MPRIRGTGPTRKRNPAAPKKQETSETVQTPEQLVERALPSVRLRGLRPLPRTPERRVSRLEAEPWPPELGSGRPQSTRTSRLPLAGRT